MKICFFIFLFSLTQSVIAQDSPEQTKAPSRQIDNIQEEQQAMEEENKVNDYKVGPYDREGNYLYYNRLQEEMKAAMEGKTEGED